MENEQARIDAFLMTAIGAVCSRAGCYEHEQGAKTYEAGLLAQRLMRESDRIAQERREAAKAANPSGDR